MNRIVNNLNHDYAALLLRARRALEGKWVRKTEHCQEITGTITQVFLNADRFEGLKVKVQWKNRPVPEDEDPRNLREW